jgi:UDP-2-acetamido-2-deoxy-ribo-hexuluronate aminotransferase
VDNKIKLFQTERCWQQIRDQVWHLVEEEHKHGKAQNGKLVQDLEQRLAQKFERKHCISVANCTDALFISLVALDLPPNSRVAVSDYTYLATAHAIARAGHIVVPVDVGDDYCVHTWPDDIDAAIAVDIFGNMCTLPDSHIPVIVDAAQSFESHDGNQWSAKKGLISCVSFSPTKTVSSWGSGGAVLTDDDDLYLRVKRLRLYGRDSHGHTAYPGINSMLSSFEAACIWAGLDHQDEWHNRRENITRHLLQCSKFITALDTELPQHTFHKLVFNDTRRTQIMKDLASQNIESSVHYSTVIHQQPWYTGKCAKSFDLSTKSFTVPNQHTLTDSEVEHIAKVLS